MMPLATAAAFIHIPANELKHAAQRGELNASLVRGEWQFDRVDLVEWAQRNLLAATHKEQKRQHVSMQQKWHKDHREDWRLRDMFRITGIDLSLQGKTRAGIVRDMADLAAHTQLVYDPDSLFRELMAREEIAATAVGEGAAFLHPRYHDQYLFEEPFIAYGRALKPVFFGSQNGEPTRHFFLVAATSHEMHLHMLARLSVMAHATEFLQILENVTTPEDAMVVIHAAEEGVLRA